jgi:glutamyl-Q tRNA(Asp) synthetase
VLWQSQRLAAYAEALAQLQAAGLAYGCACSRKEIADSASQAMTQAACQATTRATIQPAIDGGLIYPGTCRHGLPAGRSARAWRLRVNDEEIAFTDRLQGWVAQRLARDVGDFVLHRADGLFAYQLAVTVDDDFQGISDIVRGADLLASTPRQIWLQRCLGFAEPRYAHLPVVTNAAGEKLSKQTLAPALEVTKAAYSLVRALQFLGQPVPEALARASVKEVWVWAREHWRFLADPARRDYCLAASAVSPGVSSSACQCFGPYPVMPTRARTRP